MDINLKGDMDGIQTTEEILKVQKLPVIFITAFSDRPTTDRVKKTNTHGLLFKPFSDKELQATIDLALYKFKMEMAVHEREEALRLSEEKFKTITHSLLDIIFIIDRNGRQLFFNDRIETLLGYKPDEVIGSRFTRYVPYDEINEFIIQVKNIYKNKSVSQFTTKIFHKDGHLVDVEINGILVKHQDDYVIQGTIRDITERVKAQELLIESQKSYLSLFNSVNESIYIHGLDGVFLDVNKGAEKMYGYAREELLGKTPEFVSAPGKNDMQIVVEIIKRVYETGVSETFEFWGKRKDGSVFPKEVVSNKCKYFGKNIIISTARDITERKKAEVALKESENRFRGLYEHSSIGLYRTTPAGEIILANPALVKILGYNSLDELKTRNLITGEGYVEPMMRERFKEIMAEKGEITNFVTTWKTKNGEVLHLSEGATAVKYNDGSVLYYDGTVENITERKKAELALKESENKYRQFLYLSIDCIYMFDSETKEIIDANSSFLNLLGYEIHDVKNLTAYDIIAHDKKSIDWFIKNIISNGATKIGERNWKHKDGHLIPMEVTSNKMKVSEKNIIFVVARNISELKKTNEKLLQSEQLYYNLVETAQDLIWQCDEEARYVYLNPAWKSVLGYTIDEMLGKKFTEFQTKENAERDINTFSTLLKDKIIKGYESIHKHKNGSEVVLLFNAKAIITTEGKVLGTQGTAYDITERTRNEIKLRESELNLKTLFNTVGEGISTNELIYDSTGKIIDYRVLDVNAAFERIAGVKKTDIVGRLATEIYNLDSAFISEFWNQNFGSEDLIESDIFNEQINKWLHVATSQPVNNQFVVSFIDITDRIKIENEIKEKNKELEKINFEKDKLFAIIAHDLQSPFHGLIGITGLMAENINNFSQPEIQSLAKTINNTTINASNLICNLLEWSKLQLGIRELNKEKINLTEIVADATGLLEQTASFKEVKIINNISNSININCDFKMIRSILINLIANAIKFTNKGGFVKLYTETFSDDFVKVAVSDNGIGMDNNLCKDLFNIGNKVGRTGTQGEPSSGLGLMLCKEFIDKHNGKIWVESKVHQGTTFYFTLPLAV